MKGMINMINRFDYRIVDMSLFIIANLVNLLLIGIFLSRVRGLKGVEYILGIIVVAMALPLGAAVTLNALGKREWWTIVLPLLVVLFCVVELMFDYVLNLDFRNTSLLWPYLLIYYLGLMGMIGYSFLIGRLYGFVTLSTYFLNFLATWYSYSKIDHG